MDNNNFFPIENYSIPITSNYMKLPEGVNKFRVLSPAVVGYEYFNNENKPKRSRAPFDEVPADIKSGGRINHFWAFVVYNYTAERIQILEITQKSIMTQMKNYIENPDWGSPVGRYDISITRKGTSKNDTEYFVVCSPHSPTLPEVAEKYANMKVNLDALFLGTDPFKSE